MVRIELSIDLQYEVQGGGADFVFNIHGAHTRCQMISRERLTINQNVAPQLFSDALTGNRYLRMSAAQGQLHVHYEALFDIYHHVVEPEEIAEIPVAALPSSVLSYIYPSRYCQSDRLGRLAMSEFGHLPQGYQRVRAICDWVQKHVSFTQNTTNSMTSAIDTLTDRVGVCRDFAHLMIALCRALNIPARFSTGIDYGADPCLGPPDFHAYVEVFVGHRWYIFDPSGTAIPMGFIRLGTGRDAADVAFATIFGGVTSMQPLILATALSDPAGRWVMPQHIPQAISTDAVVDQPEA